MTRIGERLFRKRTMAALALLATMLCSAKAWSDTVGEAIVERTTVALPGLPAGSLLRLALISDIHVAGPDMPPGRVERIVTQVNALNPDIVLIAGDLVSEKRLATKIYTPAQIVSPLGALKAPLGVIAVPGNHDHWFDLPGLSAELRKHRIALLANEARQVGPLVIGGLDDAYTGRADVRATLASMKGLDGARIMLSHSPDPFPELPRSVSLTLAGHTHCGQIAYPWGGAPAHLSDHGDRYGCGRIDEQGKVLVVGAGLGTSLVPLRLFTRPTVWLIELRPVGAR